MLNVSQHSQENTFTGVSFLINIVVAFNLSLSLFKNRFRHWCFADSYLKLFTKIFLKREKKHCYEKRSIVIRNVDQISIANLLTLLFYNFAKISVFQQGVSTVYSDNRLFYQSKNITESSKSLTIDFWQSLNCQNSHWADLIGWYLCNAPPQRFISWVFLTVPRLFYQVL